MAASASNGRKPLTVGHRDRWLRLLYMVIFAIIGYTVFWVILFLAAVQFVLAWINGEPNDNLRDFAAKLDRYLCGVVDFIGYATDVVPFPLSPLEASVAAAAPAAPGSARRTSRARSRSRKKAASDETAPGADEG
jgi:hypothetical protein